MVYLLRREILNYKQLMTHNFKDDQIDRIIEMAWEDRTPFDAIELQFGLKENDVRKIMRTSLKESSLCGEKELLAEKQNIFKNLKVLDLNQKIKGQIAYNYNA